MRAFAERQGRVRPQVGRLVAILCAGDRMPARAELQNFRGVSIPIASKYKKVGFRRMHCPPPYSGSPHHLLLALQHLDDDCLLSATSISIMATHRVGLRISIAEELILLPHQNDKGTGLRRYASPMKADLHAPSCTLFFVVPAPLGQPSLPYLAWGVTCAHSTSTETYR